MTKKEHSDLIDILSSPHFDTRLKALKYLESIEPEEEVKGQRTSAQNRALHKWTTMIADALNNEGYDFPAVIEKMQTIDVPMTGELVKKLFVHTAIKHLYNKDSTAHLTKDQISGIIDPITKVLGERFELEYIPFPHMDDVRFAQVDNLQDEAYPDYDPDKHEPTI